MSQLNKVAKFLRSNSKKSGVTASMIASGTGVPRTSVMKRIYDLRVNEGFAIDRTRRVAGGKVRVYYRMSA
jgi:biotin operon repressor